MIAKQQSPAVKCLSWDEIDKHVDIITVIFCVLLQSIAIPILWVVIIEIMTQRVYAFMVED